MASSGGGTGGFFISKKQKHKMRERRRKKKRFERQEQQRGVGGEDRDVGSNAGRSKKRSRATEQEELLLESGFGESIGDVPPSGGGRQREKEDDNDGGDAAATNSEVVVVVVPANLTSKQAKKFRKDARRKARSDTPAAGRGNLSPIVKFVVEGEKQDEKEEQRPQQQQTTKPPKKKKQKLEFPRINEILETAKLREEDAAKKEALERENALLPEAYKRQYVALDCEMVGIGTEGRKSALARVSIVDWHSNVLLDTFVQVATRVTDFRTHVSGVKPKHIRSDNDAMNEKDCREKVAAILNGKILVGHALKNDLHALMLRHPKEMIRDTARYRPLQRYGGNKWRPRKLRDLVKEHCNINIQQEGESHDSVDDATATMELFKVFRREWEEEIQAKAEKKQRRR